MPVITAITPQKRRKGRYSLFIDDTFFLGLDEEILFTAKLKVGQEIDPDRLKELVEREEYHHAKQYVFTLLSRRLYTCHEIKTKLTQKGFEPSIIGKLITDFVSKNYLNDRQFAEMWIDNRIHSRPRGPAMLRRELLNKGIDRGLVSELLEPISSTDELVRLGKKALRKKKFFQQETDTRNRKRKVYQYLARKGFPPDVISEIAQWVMGNKSDSTLDE